MRFCLPSPSRNVNSLKTSEVFSDLNDSVILIRGSHSDSGKKFWFWIRAWPACSFPDLLSCPSGSQGDTCSPSFRNSSHSPWAPRSLCVTWQCHDPSPSALVGETCQGCQSKNWGNREKSLESCPSGEPGFFYIVCIFVTQGAVQCSDHKTTNRKVWLLFYSKFWYTCCAVNFCTWNMKQTCSACQFINCIQFY